MTIRFSVCIPCWPFHTSKLKRCLLSIKAQTLQPFEVIIGHSEITEKNAQTIIGWFKKYPFPVHCIYTEDPKFAGGNRNMAAEHVSRKSTHIVFFDADDTMHPRKLEITSKIFQQYNPKGFVHRFHRVGKQRSSRYNYENPTVIYGEDLYLRTYEHPKKQLVKFRLPDIHHGHITIKKDVFRHIKQRENEQRGQDAFFIADIYKKYGPCAMALANIPLCDYNSSDVPNRKGISAAEMLSHLQKKKK